MKRYGFKFQLPDGAYAKGVELRYFSVGGGLLFGFLTGMFNPAQGLLILATIPIFWVLSFLIEGWPKLFLLLTAIVGLLIFSLSVASLLAVPDRTQIDLVLGVILSLLYYSVYVFIGVRGHREHDS